MPVRGVVFPLAHELPLEVRSLLADFRLLVNESVRAALAGGVTSRNGISRLVYKESRETHPGIYAKHIGSAFEVASSLLKCHRRRLREGARGKTPFVNRLMMKANNQAYKLNRTEGVVNLPIRAGCNVELRLVLSQYHRRYLDDSTLSLGSLTVLSDRVIIAFRKDVARLPAASSVIALDTNESSLDGIFVQAGDQHADATIVKASFPDVAMVQQRHHARRKRLQKKKAHDRRLTKILCTREGKREHDRVTYRLHQVADSVVNFAEAMGSAIVLEDLRGMSFSGNKELNRRLSLWPRRKLHQIIEYKAMWRGIPVMKVDPRYSSRKCPICGRVSYSRMGARSEFACKCGWRMDRHINASVNLLQTAMSDGLDVAGGLRFSPGAIQHDVVMTLYEPAMAARSEPNGMSLVSTGSYNVIARQSNGTNDNLLIGRILPRSCTNRPSS